MSGTKKGTDKTVIITTGKNIMTVQESAEQHSLEEYNLFNMKSADQRKPYTATLEVNGKPIVMEIDTHIVMEIDMHIVMEIDMHKNC